MKVLGSDTKDKILVAIIPAILTSTIITLVSFYVTTKVVNAEQQVKLDGVKETLQKEIKNLSKLNKKYTSLSKETSVDSQKISNIFTKLNEIQESNKNMREDFKGFKESVNQERSNMKERIASMETKLDYVYDYIRNNRKH